MGRKQRITDEEEKIRKTKIECRKFGGKKREGTPSPHTLITVIIFKASSQIKISLSLCKFSLLTAT